MTLHWSFLRGTAAALAIAAAGILGMGATPVRAQLSVAETGLPPDQIESQIEADGYQLAGPVTRRGALYFANVLAPGDKPLRLVIDARDGRVLHHYPGDPSIRRQAADSDEWSPVTTFFDGLFGRRDDVAPLSPPPASDFLETPKSKPAVRRAKAEPTPSALPAKAPGDSNPAAAAPPAPAPTAAASAAPVNAGGPPPASASAPVAKAASPKVNDVPVSPLE
jgi:hypothetical protein